LYSQSQGCDIWLSVSKIVNRQVALRFAEGVKLHAVTVWLNVIQTVIEEIYASVMVFGSVGREGGSDQLINRMYDEIQ